MVQWRGGGDEAARWGRCASERRLRRGRRALSCGTAWTDTRGHLARERSTRATGVGRARGMAGKWARESGVRAACVRWMVGRGVSETGGKRVTRVAPELERSAVVTRAAETWTRVGRERRKRARGPAGARGCWRRGGPRSRGEREERVTREVDRARGPCSGLRSVCSRGETGERARVAGRPKRESAARWRAGGSGPSAHVGRVWRSGPNQGKRERAAGFAGLGEEGKAGPAEEKGWA